ncbi:Hypothetical protein A7982_08766 [Minicystis rosea]|nr:Hypothetical protein A7982_08766 [Minicystis rosea]
MVSLIGGAAMGGSYGCAGAPAGGENVGETPEAIDNGETVSPIIDPPIVIDPVECPEAPECTKMGAKVDPSLVVPRPTHAALLDTHFQLESVLQQILNLAGTSNETPTELLRRLWDTENPAGSGAFSESFQPHCTPGGSLNGYPLECGRFEGSLAFSTVPSDFIPVALFNRFDLAPTDGAHCGEYRIVYSSTAVTGAIILEGQLPNPHPECGIEACRPVAEFWQSLSSAPDEATLGTRLRKFYYEGIHGFSPVIHPQSYGFDAGGGRYGASGGQIRINTITSSWQLREFHLARSSTLIKNGNKLFAQPVTVKNNPFGDLFKFTSTRPEAGPFQSFFVNGGEIASLAATNVNNVAMATDDQFNAGQSTSVSNPINDYVLSLNAGGAGNPFVQSIDAELHNLFCAPGTACTPPLNPQHIAERATSQSCAGCHQNSNGRDLGNGMTWPNSLGFLHVGFGGELSDALTCTFLPHRQSVLLTFLRNCGTTAPVVTPAGCNTGGGRIVPTPIEPLLSKESNTLGGGSSVN